MNRVALPSLGILILGKRGCQPSPQLPGEGKMSPPHAGSHTQDGPVGGGHVAEGSVPCGSPVSWCEQWGHRGGHFFHGHRMLSVELADREAVGLDSMPLAKHGRLRPHIETRHQHKPRRPQLGVLPRARFVNGQVNICPV